MIEDCSTLNYASYVIHWQPHGRAFAFHDRDHLVQEVLWQYFDSRNMYASFQRQLQQYGFLKLTVNGLDNGAYYHELFLRGRPDLTKLMLPFRRTTGKLVRHKYDPQTEPNFYAVAAQSSPAYGMSTSTPGSLVGASFDKIQRHPAHVQLDFPNAIPPTVGFLEMNNVALSQVGRDVSIDATMLSVPASVQLQLSMTVAAIPAAKRHVPLSPITTAARTAVKEYLQPTVIDHHDRVSFIHDGTTGWLFDDDGVAYPIQSTYDPGQPTVHQVASTFPSLQHHLEPSYSDSMTESVSASKRVDRNNHECLRLKRAVIRGSHWTFRVNVTRFVSASYQVMTIHARFNPNSR